MGVREHPEPVTGEWLADPARWAALAAELGEVLAAHAAREPLAAGLPIEAARAALGLPDRRLVTALARPPFRVAAGLVQLMPAGGAPPRGCPRPWPRPCGSCAPTWTRRRSPRPTPSGCASSGWTSAPSRPPSGPAC